MTYWIILFSIFLLLLLVVLYNKKKMNVEGFQAQSYALPTELLLINMDMRTDRLASFQNSYDKSDCKDKLPLHRISAVVGKTVDWKSGLLTPEATKDLEEVVQTGKRKGHASLTVGAVGCYMSHLKAMEYVVEKNRPMIVCEDDLILPPDFFEKVKSGLLLPTPNQPIMLLFHVLCTGWDQLKCILKKDNFYEVHRFWSTACYYITPETARIILANAKPLEFQIDSMMSALVSKNLINIYAYPIANTEAAFGSDIQTHLA